MSYYEMPYKLLFAITVAMGVLSVIYYMNDLGCSISDCSETKNSSVTNGQTICNEANRITWRRSVMIAFIIFIFTNIVYPPPHWQKSNLVIFLFVTSIMYFFLNFEQYHRYRLMCKSEQNKIS
jgi:hypothetical protein